MGGPRFNVRLRAKERASADNGIWLCQNCAKLVDNDEARYPVDLLKEWKRVAEADALARIGKPPTLSAAPTSQPSMFMELRRESNPRFGFSFLYPVYWDRQDPTNGDGNTYRHPGDPRVEVRAWGGYAVAARDLFEWVKQTIEWLGTESGFELTRTIPSGRHLVDFSKTADGVIESRQQIEGVRIVYGVVINGAKFTATRTFVQYEDTQIGVLCQAPAECYAHYEELFLEISHAVRLLGANSAPFARASPDTVGNLSYDEPGQTDNDGAASGNLRP